MCCRKPLAQMGSGIGAMLEAGRRSLVWSFLTEGTTENWEKFIPFGRQNKSEYISFNFGG
jgi:hypothetical protein